MAKIKTKNKVIINNNNNTIYITLRNNEIWEDDVLNLLLNIRETYETSLLINFKDDESKLFNWNIISTLDSNKKILIYNKLTNNIFSKIEKIEIKLHNKIKIEEFMANHVKQLNGSRFELYYLNSQTIEEINLKKKIIENDEIIFFYRLEGGIIFFEIKFKNYNQLNKVYEISKTILLNYDIDKINVYKILNENKMTIKKKIQSLLFKQNFNSFKNTLISYNDTSLDPSDKYQETDNIYLSGLEFRLIDNSNFNKFTEKLDKQTGIRAYKIIDKTTKKNDKKI